MLAFRQVVDSMLMAVNLRGIERGSKNYSVV